jgi:hypothetical protein
LEDQNPEDFEDALIEQSLNISDNQGVEPQFLRNKSDGQLLEDVKVGGPWSALGLISLGGRSALASPNDDDPLVDQRTSGQLELERSSRPSHVVEGGGDALQVEMQPQDHELIEALIQRGQARDLGERPRFRSETERRLSEEVEVGGSRATLEQFNGGRTVLTAKPVKSMTAQEEIQVSRSEKYTGCFRVRRDIKYPEDSERQERIGDCEYYLKQDPRFQRVMEEVKPLQPGPERIKVVDEFWGTAFRNHWGEERDSIRSRGKALAEYIGLRDEDRLRRLEYERSTGPSHVVEGGGDVRQSNPILRLRRSSVVTDGPSSLASSVVGSESVPGLGLTDTCATSGRPSQT